MDLVHHWQPCFWTVSAILIVLSTVVAKNAVSSVHVQYWLRVQTLSNRFLFLGGWKRVPRTWQSTREPSCSWLFGEPLLFLTSRSASQAHLPLRAGAWSSGRWNFFFVSTFQSAGWYSSCWNVSSCCVHVRMCCRKKTAERKMCLSRTTHGHESKKQTKRIIHAGAAKKCRNRMTPNPLKISIQGRYSKWG